MDVFLSEMIMTCVGVVSAASVAITYMTLRYFSKREQIKAETLLKAEEIRAKNRLELLQQSNGSMKMEELLPPMDEKN